ncbi:MAG: DUF4173 domain-containing protein [Novosphingobium sp.]|nr:DUF4173 domain-containing protein [Novosphingobium sp.]
MRLLSKHRWDGAFALKLALTALLVLLGNTVFWELEQVTGVQGIFMLGLCAALAAARPAVRKDKRALVALGFAALYGFAQLWDPSPLAFALFWVAIGLATLLPGTARFDDGWRWFQRLFVHLFKSLFGPLIDFGKFDRMRRRRSPRPLGLRRGASVLVLPLLGSALFLWLFAAANPVIASWLASISPPDFDWTFLPRLILLGALALLAWGVLRPRPPRRTFGTFDGSGDLRIPGFSLASVTLALVMFNALFALQNVMDLAYLSDLAELPKGIVLSEYAHRGADPLVATALLAALFVLVALRPGSSTAQSPLARGLVTLWIAQNLVLVASAAWRTWGYVQAYDLTRLRIAALLWMALVALGLVLVLYRMLKEKSASWLINANLISSGALLTAVCFVDLGAVAASWNVRHAREIDGTGARMDLCYLSQLGDSALLPLLELDQRKLPGEFGQRVSRVRLTAQSRAAGMAPNGMWSLRNHWRLAEYRRLSGVGTIGLYDGGESDCHGRPYHNYSYEPASTTEVEVPRNASRND